ncbi:GNAT family N-acetyltransferase [Lacrimispora sp. JR3]|uniref:GNAT family N-acetyltransferase n=1 Tax=Lacrimispora sinapis TaxID=3111456 RepID=UPI0037480553
MIKKAGKEDIQAVAHTYRELLLYEKEHGSHSNWVLDVYPTKENAQKSYEEGTLYVLEENGEICASMVLNHLQSEEYAKIPWRYPADPAEVLVLHTLCIPPSKAGKGMGIKMVGYALNQAKELGCKVMRLDTHAENEPAARLYKKLGFQYAGTADVLHEGLIPEKQIFFERIIL